MAKCNQLTSLPFKGLKRPMMFCVQVMRWRGFSVMCANCGSTSTASASTASQNMKTTFAVAAPRNATLRLSPPLSRSMPNDKRWMRPSWAPSRLPVTAVVVTTRTMMSTWKSSMPNLLTVTSSVQAESRQLRLLWEARRHARRVTGSLF